MGKRVQKLYEQIVFERRVLLVCTILVFIAAILWFVAVSTDYWVTVDGGQGIYLAKSKRYFLGSRTGIWRVCRQTYVNATGGVKNGTRGDRGHFETSCSTQKAGKAKSGSLPDIHLLNYNRAEAVFSVITVILMLMGLMFSFYTFKNSRYMFKRTSGALHFLSAASSFTVIEVVKHAVDYERKHVPFFYPPGATHEYGFSFALAWLVFLCNLISGFAFMIFSRKRKGKKAPTEEMAMADEPAIIGR